MNIFWSVFAAILAAAAVVALLVSGRLSRRFLWRILGLIIGGLFVYAGVLKAIDPVQFATDIDNYKMVPWSVAVGLAFYLPWLEILAGALVIFRVLFHGALAILTALISVFIVATIAAKIRNLDITCGCFGHASQNWSFPAHMATDLAILGTLLVLWFASRSRPRQTL